MVYSQGIDIIGVVELPVILPKWHYKVNGENDNMSLIGFKLLSDLGNYIADWIDFLGDEKLVSAKIHLYKMSQVKSFNGKKIVDIIDAMARVNNYKGITSFNER